MLKVGLIVDEGDLPYIAHNLISRSRQATHYDVECLIVQRINHAHGSSTFEKFLRSIKTRGVLATLRLLSFLVIEKFERRVVSTKANYRQAFTQVSRGTFSIDVLECMPEISDSGLVYRYEKHDLQQISSRGLDILVRCGSGILRGEILNVCRFGIMSIHHGDNNRYRGGPPGFWEVFHRSPDTGFIVQILTEELDGGKVLIRGSISTTSLATLNQARLLIKANVFLHYQLEKIGESGTLPAPLPATPYCYPLYTIPKLGILVAYLVRCAAHLSKKLVDKVLGRELQWGVSYQYVKKWHDAVLWKSIEIKNPAGRFFADPTIICENDQTICFVEDYHYSEEKAKITAISITPDGHEILGTALEENFHLSYPFIFRDKGEIYMCPETRSINEIRVYRCVEFPLRWQLHKTLLINVAAVDTNIVKHEGRYWLFTNQDSAALEDFGSELHLYYAEALDSDHWTAHPGNPVVFDSLSGRNGGIINSDGIQHYRVSQAQGFDFYGKGITVNTIVELSTHEYREQAISSISANYSSKVEGVHSLNFNEGIVVFDRVSTIKMQTTVVG